MKIVDVPQGSAEWKLARLGLATASNFGQIMAEPKKKNEEAVTRAKYRHRLVLERVTGRAPTSFESFAMRQGIEREPAARLAFEIATGETVQQIGLARHDVLEAAASPDGLMPTAGLEIKSPEPSAHLAVLRTGRIPSVYVPQVQGGMWLCERATWRFVSFNPDFPDDMQLVDVIVQRDRDYIDNLAAEVIVFLNEVREEVDEFERIRARRRAA